MKIYKITPLQSSFFDMGIIGKCSALYIQADCENDARYFALLNKQTSTTQDVVPGCASSLFEEMFNIENANCIELEEQEIQYMLDGNDLGINLVKVDFWR